MPRDDGILTAVVGTEYVIKLEATDENGDNITYALSEDLSFASINQSMKLCYTNPNPNLNPSPNPNP